MVFFIKMGLVYSLCRLLFGNLYPAYASYKAVRTKNVKEYVKWMMYWIVFALFTCCETFTDVFLGFWFPFYYEIKIILVIWLLSPATKGSSFLYRKFVHPMLTKREPEIDEYLSRAKEQSYHTMLHLGTRGMTYATNVIMQTAIKGGGGIVNHLRKSYSLCDLSSNSDMMSEINMRNKALQAEDSTTDGSQAPNFQRDQRTTRSMRKAAAGNNHVDMYFPEVDVNIRSHPSRESSVPLSQIRSTDDISSGYSSADPVYAGEMTGEGLMRTSSVGGARARATRGGSTRAASKRGLTTEGSDLLDDFDEPSVSSTQSSSWMQTNPSIPFYPTPFPPMCISSRPDERILFSANIDVVKNQLALLKAFQDAQTYMGNNTLINVNNKGHYVANYLLANNSNVCSSNNTDNVVNHENNSSECLGNNEEFNESPDANTVQMPNSNPNFKIESNFEPDLSLNVNTRAKPEENLKRESNLIEMEEFHDSLVDLSSVVVDDPVKRLSTSSELNDNTEIKLNLPSNLTNTESTQVSDSSKIDTSVEKHESEGNLTEISVTKTELIVPDGEFKPKTPPRRGRYNKKKQAPLPPNSLKTDSIVRENDEDDFQDAESETVSLFEDTDNKFDDVPQSLANTPDLLSEINVSGVKNDESDIKETAGDDKFDKHCLNPGKNIVDESVSCTEKPPRNSDTPSYTGDGMSKSKQTSKLSKFLPKNSNVPSFFGFLHGKDTTLQPDESKLKSGVVVPTNESQKEKLISTAKTSNEEKLDGVFIPLTDDTIKEQEDEFVQIREMSQSPTARRKHPDGS